MILISSILFISILSIFGCKVYNFLSGRSLFLDAIDRYKLSKFTLTSASQYWQNNTNQSNIIICLTSIPSRINHLESTLISLLTQKVAPKIIRLHIPDYSKREKIEYTIPQQFVNLPGIKIVRCDDHGPATKFIPAIEELPETQPILIVDDDYLYPPNLVSRYDLLHLENPDIIIGSSGWLVPTDLTDKPTTLWSNIKSIPPTPILCTRLKKNIQIDIIQGFSGYLIQPRFFDLSQLKDYQNVPKNVFFVDDVWISAHAKVSKWVFPEKRFCFDTLTDNNLYKYSSLGKINNGNGNNENRNNTIAIRYFKNKWLLSQKKTTSPFLK